MDIACLSPADGLNYPKRFEGICRERTGYDLRFHGFKPHQGELPRHTDFDAVFVTGSRFHVYDRQDWVQETEQYLQQVIDDDVPALGVCYGHQLLADVLGGSVGPLAEVYGQEREFGYQEVAVTPGGRTHPLFADMPERFLAFTSHLDQVSALPEGSTVLAANEYGVQSFAVDEKDVYGVQFHPEYNLSMANDLLQQKSLPDSEVERFAESLTPEHAAEAVVSRTVFDNFLTRIV